MSTILVIDDDPAMQQVFTRLLSDEQISVMVAESTNRGLQLLEEQRPDVVLLDIMLPDASGLDTFKHIRERDPHLPVIFITSDQTSDTAIEAMRLGAFEYLTKPLNFPRVRQIIAQAIEIRRLMRVPVAMGPDGEDDGETSDLLVGRCAAMQEVYKQIGRVASQNLTTLIYGESGTGKELIARAIYQHSSRASGPFLAVNCAAIPEPLLESELFGHEKGGFTGADSRRIGKFEQCSGGTLFLDEIGDMTPLVQSKVLRVLQEQQFERVGGNQTITTDVRILAATNRDLEAMVTEGTFRADLYYRLTGFTISLPPLRDRGDDLILLTKHLLRRLGPQLGKNVTDIAPQTIEMLKSYDWPGNIRELQNVVKQAILRSTGPVLLPQFLPPEVTAKKRTQTAAPQAAASSPLETFVGERLQAGSTRLYEEALEFLERRLLTQVLQQTHGNQSQAAKILGITRGSLRNKIRRLGITLDFVVGVSNAEPSTNHHPRPAETSPPDE
ncbi:MAG: sigma-54-dependent Fis family transcriptional regulator [Pirellulales bacterium]|nr:sigma-54-dependent Fis family transcriptional regulator [Pirellulales bacterium]